MTPFGGLSFEFWFTGSFWCLPLAISYDHTIPDSHNVSHSTYTIIPHLNGVVLIWQQSHTFLRSVIKFEALFSFIDFHLQKRSPIQWCLHAKYIWTSVCVYSHLMVTSTCICYVLRTYILHSPRCHTFGQNKTKHKKLPWLMQWLMYLSLSGKLYYIWTN
jgi:hypothetical protein